MIFFFAMYYISGLLQNIINPPMCVIANSLFEVNNKIKRLVQSFVIVSLETI